MPSAEQVVPPAKRIIVAITGASGSTYGVTALRLLREMPDVETHLVVTSGGRSCIAEETSMTLDEVYALADVSYPDRNTGATIASGSFRTDGMIVAPCSIKSLSGIANSYNDSLVTRAADVCLKERRPVVLLVRETPFHAGHLQLMQQADAAGAIIMPPVPAFYSRPTTVEDIVTHTVSRALDLLGCPVPGMVRWGGRGSIPARE